MKKMVILQTLLGLLNVSLHGDWVAIDLPHSYHYPSESSDEHTKLSTLTIPLSPASDGHKATCKAHPKGHFRPTSTTYVSNHLKEINGLSFTGHIQKGITETHYDERGDRFGIFFHQVPCYTGGPEYGFIFFDNSMSSRFYCSINSNIKDEALPAEQREKWKEWPSKSSCSDDKGTIKKNCQLMRGLFADASRYR